MTLLAPPVIKPEELEKMAPSAGVAAPEAPALVAPPPPAAPAAAPMEVKPLAAVPPKAPPPAAKSAKKAAAPEKVAAKTPAAKRTAGGAYRVQMSSLRSQSAVQKSWVSLRKRHTDLLGKLSLSIEETTLSGDRGKYYRMQAGPLKTKSEASALCNSLKKRKQSCIVVKR